MASLIGQTYTDSSGARPEVVIVDDSNIVAIFSANLSNYPVLAHFTYDRFIGTLTLQSSMSLPYPYNYSYMCDLWFDDVQKKLYVVATDYNSLSSYTYVGYIDLNDGAGGIDWTKFDITNLKGPANPGQQYDQLSYLGGGYTIAHIRTDSSGNPYVVYAGTSGYHNFGYFDWNTGTWTEFNSPDVRTRSFVMSRPRSDGTFVVVWVDTANSYRTYFYVMSPTDTSFPSKANDTYIIDNSIVISDYNGNYYLFWGDPKVRPDDTIAIGTLTSNRIYNIQTDNSFTYTIPVAGTGFIDVEVTPSGSDVYVWNTDYWLSSNTTYLNINGTDYSAYPAYAPKAVHTVTDNVFGICSYGSGVLGVFSLQVPTSDIYGIDINLQSTGPILRKYRYGPKLGGGLI